MTVISWVHIIESEDQFNKIYSFTFNNRNILIVSYLVIEGVLICSDGRVLGK